MSKQSLNLPYIVLAGVIIVAIVAIFAVLQPMFKTLQSVRDNVATTQKNIAEKEAFLVTVDRKKVQLREQELHERQLAVILPTDAALKDVVRILQQLATASGLTITDIINTGDAEKNRVTALRTRGEAVDIPAATDPVILQIKAGGTYQQIRVFIEQLERTPRIMDVLSMSLDRSTTAPEQLSLELSVKVYNLSAITANAQ